MSSECSKPEDILNENNTSPIQDFIVLLNRLKLEILPLTEVIQINIEQLADLEQFDNELYQSIFPVINTQWKTMMSILDFHLARVEFARLDREEYQASLHIIEHELMYPLYIIRRGIYQILVWSDRQYVKSLESNNVIFALIGAVDQLGRLINPPPLYDNKIDFLFTEAGIDKLDSFISKLIHLIDMVKANILNLDSSGQFASKASFEFPLIISNCEQFASLISTFLNQSTESGVSTDCDENIELLKIALMRNTNLICGSIDIIHIDYVIEHIKSSEYDSIIKDLLDTATSLSRFIFSPTNQFRWSAP